MGLVISDQNTGLVAAVGRVLLGTSDHRYEDHFARNLGATVAKERKDVVAAAFLTILVQAASNRLLLQIDAVGDGLAVARSNITALTDDAETGILALPILSKSHSQRT